jgi:hypothetical protein
LLGQQWFPLNPIQSWPTASHFLTRSNRSISAVAVLGKELEVLEIVRGLKCKPRHFNIVGLFGAEAKQIGLPENKEFIVASFKIKRYSFR